MVDDLGVQVHQHAGRRPQIMMYRPQIMMYFDIPPPGSAQPCA